MQYSFIACFFYNSSSFDKTIVHGFVNTLDDTPASKTDWGAKNNPVLYNGFSERSYKFFTIL